MNIYIFLFLLGATFTLNAQEIELNVPIVTQEQSKWCGAAVSQSVIRYLPPNRVTKQCDIMVWVRQNPPPPESNKCCDDSIPQYCNQEGIDLYGSQRSIQAVLSHFGEINSYPYSLKYPPPAEIYECLSNNRPLIIGLRNPFNNEGHAVVVRGIYLYPALDIIYYMDPSDDPRYGGNREMSYINLISGVNIHRFNWDQTLITCSSSKDDLCNYVGGGGGGDDPCSNCILDPGEETIDCGGTCPPCGYIGNVTDEIMITNTAQLRTVMMAFKRITACDSTTVVSRDNVTFITKKTGSIFLYPGFTAEEGSTFSTQMKDLSEYERPCGAICPAHTLSETHKAFFDFLRINNLLYAVGFDYDIYKSGGGSPIHSKNLKINYDGMHYLWDCTTNAGDGLIGTVSYYIRYKIHYCNHTSSPLLTHNFTVNYYCKSLTEEPDDPETPPQFSPPHPNNTPLHSATAPPQFTITPNPNPGTFQLETNFPLTNIAHLKILTPLGATLYETQTLSSHTIQLPTSATGLHFVVIMLKDGAVLTQKMVIQR
ncbi:MAG: T9SS type A sorting domain-containing protein [Lentimicrobiaceae bacterium]|nr:T9SS type A sorting domain-containing protein [Lentimicrobiaceae bacterium]